MGSRLELQTMLEQILGSRNVYFQPPEELKMRYPAIKYNLSDLKNTFADDEVYKQSHHYEVTVIDYDPDGELYKKISKLPKIRFNRHFTSDNLNHYVFTIYY